MGLYQQDRFDDSASGWGRAGPPAWPVRTHALAPPVNADAKVSICGALPEETAMRASARYFRQWCRRAGMKLF